MEAAICFYISVWALACRKFQHAVLIDQTVGSDHLQKEGRAGVILLLLFLTWATNAPYCTQEAFYCGDLRLLVFCFGRRGRKGKEAEEFLTNSRICGLLSALSSDAGLAGEEDHYSRSSTPPPSPNTLHTTNFLFFSLLATCIYIHLNTNITSPHTPALPPSH